MAGTMMAEPATVVVGIDTHADTHVAVALSNLGARLGCISVPTTVRGFAELLGWARGLGEVTTFGIEGTGSFGATLMRFLQDEKQLVVEVSRPDRRIRRQDGKSDPIDAEAAARTVLSGKATGIPKSGDGRVEMIRSLRVARRSALKARTQAANQLHALVITCPESLRSRLHPLAASALAQLVAKFRPGPMDGPEAAAKLALRHIGRRYVFLDAEIASLDGELDVLVAKAAPALLELVGVGTDVAGALLVAAGDNPERLGGEASFARLCGAAPLPASSGKTTRHRLSRGGDRIANNALWRIVIVRMRCDARTRCYVDRRTKEGLTKREIIRCLKRYVARDVFRCLEGVDEL
jgi:transposase